jgi:hypothetical protein
LKECSGSHYGISTDARSVSDEGTEFLNARAEKVRTYSCQDLFGSALIAVVANNTAGLEIHVLTEIFMECGI